MRKGTRADNHLVSSNLPCSSGGRASPESAHGCRRNHLGLLCKKLHLALVDTIGKSQQHTNNTPTQHHKVQNRQNIFACFIRFKVKPISEQLLIQLNSSSQDLFPVGIQVQIRLRGLDIYKEIRIFLIRAALKTEPFPLPLFPTITTSKEGWKRCLYYLLSYRPFFFKSAGLCSFLSDLLPPLHILFCVCFARHLSMCLTPGLSVHYSCINMCLTFILLHQMWDSLSALLPLSFCLHTHQKTYFFALSLGSAVLLCLYRPPVFLSSLIFLPCQYYFLLFCTFFFSVTFHCLLLSGLLVLFLLSSFHLLLWFFPIEQLNLKDYRDIFSSIIFYFTLAWYYWNQQQASHTLPGELEGIRSICYLPNGGSLWAQIWSVYIRIKCRLQFESEPYALP